MSLKVCALLIHVGLFGGISPPGLYPGPSSQRALLDPSLEEPCLPQNSKEVIPTLGAAVYDLLGDIWSTKVRSARPTGLPSQAAFRSSHRAVLSKQTCVFYALRLHVPKSQAYTANQNYDS